MKMQDKHLLNEFPYLPSYKGKWWPVFMEPIIGSGERIAIAIIAEGYDGEIAWHQGISKRVMAALGKDTASGLTGLISTAIDHYLKSRNAGLSFDEILPPFSGFFVGASNATSSKDISGILEQGVRSTSLFSSIKELQSQTTNQQNSRFLNDIRDITLEVKPDLAAFFHQSFRVSDTARRTPIDFIGNRSAISFAKFPDSARNLGYYVGQAKIKLWNLNSFRAFDDRSKNDKYELIILNPEKVTLSGLSDHQRTILRESFNELTLAADAEDIRITEVADAPRASSRLLQLEAA